MRLFTLPAILLFWSSISIAQTGEILNLTAVQCSDGSMIMDITYDLIGEEESYTITATVSFDGGDNYLPVYSAGGDIGANISPGNDKQIQWQIALDYPDSFSNTARMKITAESSAAYPVVMVSIPGGSFQMGCTPEGDDDCSTNEFPRHTVTLSSYAISATEITSCQYADYLNAALAAGFITATSSSVHGPWNGAGNYEYIYLAGSYNGVSANINYSDNEFTVNEGMENYPVVYVSWYGAVAFAEYYGGRLPTEAEWEYAARSGGTEEKWSGTGSEAQLPEYAWYSANNNPYGPKPVGTKLPNSLGLYDMSGNVYEWCSDWYSSGYYDVSPEVNPQGPLSGSYRVRRGGYFSGNAYSLRCSSRYYSYPSITLSGIGFRMASTN